MCIFPFLGIASLAHKLFRSVLVSKSLEIFLSAFCPDFSDSVMVRERALDGFSSCKSVEVCFMTRTWSVLACVLPAHVGERPTGPWERSVCCGVEFSVRVDGSVGWCAVELCIVADVSFYWFCPCRE